MRFRESCRPPARGRGLKPDLLDHAPKKELVPSIDAFFKAGGNFTIRQKGGNAKVNCP
jgi:hypothetical protein